MNKARRMAALQAREMARRGIAVLQIDLFGCGDSSGDFGDASWESWIDDAQWAYNWLANRHGVPVGFWGLRAGCLLACEAAQRLNVPVDFLFWQPVASGAAHLAQFLRLSHVAGLLGDRPQEKSRARETLAAGQLVEVAGYRLSPALASGLERAVLKPPPRARHGLWIEVDPREEGDLSPATRNAMPAWQTIHQHPLQSARVRGPAFWQTQEIEDAPELIRITADRISSWDAA
jgi:exosortase A-associated hydrolase 2